MISFPPSDDVFIVGSSGMLGRELVAACRRHGLSYTALDGSASLDIACAPAVKRAIHDRRPKIVINAAGYTHVDGAECDFERALAINGDGPGNLANACAETRSLLVHFSSDYIFGGDHHSPYAVDASPDPISSYGLSKLAGEKAVLSSGCDYLMVRTSWLFAPHGKNFVATILKLAEERECIEVVNDQRGRPTYCPDLAELTFRLLQRERVSPRREHTGQILHVANSGHATWFDLARQVVARAGLDCEVRPCTSESRLLHAPRPAYSVLDLSETIRLIGRPRHWREALRDCLAAMSVPQNGQLHLFRSGQTAHSVRENAT